MDLKKNWFADRLTNLYSKILEHYVWFKNCPIGLLTVMQIIYVNVN